MLNHESTSELVVGWFHKEHPELSHLQTRSLPSPSTVRLREGYPLSSFVLSLGLKGRLPATPLKWQAFAYHRRMIVAELVDPVRAARYQMGSRALPGGHNDPWL